MEIIELINNEEVREMLMVLFKNVNPIFIPLALISYYLGTRIKNDPTKKDWKIPFLIVGGCSVLLIIWNIATDAAAGIITGPATAILSLVNGLMQGILVSGVPVLISQMKKQNEKRIEMSEAEREKFNIDLPEKKDDK